MPKKQTSPQEQETSWPQRSALQTEIPTAFITWLRLYSVNMQRLPQEQLNSAQVCSVSRAEAERWSCLQASADLKTPRNPITTYSRLDHEALKARLRCGRLVALHSSAPISGLLSSGASVLRRLGLLSCGLNSSTAPATLRPEEVRPARPAGTDKLHIAAAVAALVVAEWQLPPQGSGGWRRALHDNRLLDHGLDRFATKWRLPHIPSPHP